VDTLDNGGRISAGRSRFPMAIQRSSYVVTWRQKILGPNPAICSSLPRVIYKTGQTHVLYGEGGSMGWLILILLLGYLTVASITAKRYYLRRHGVLPRQGEPGLSWAGQIGLAWPVTIFLRSVQKPNQCNHPRHNPHPLARPSTTAMSYPHPPIKQPAMSDLNAQLGRVVSRPVVRSPHEPSPPCSRR
jgi:hypothetical protein